MCSWSYSPPIRLNRNPNVDDDDDDGDDDGDGVDDSSHDSAATVRSVYYDGRNSAAADVRRSLDGIQRRSMK